jgi:hypothetical protein
MYGSTCIAKNLAAKVPYIYFEIQLLCKNKEIYEVCSDIRKEF